jgi:hypothetical protein
MIAIVAVVGGIGLLARGELFVGVVLILVGPLIARDAYLKYRAGNWP